MIRFIEPEFGENANAFAVPNPIKSGHCCCCNSLMNILYTATVIGNGRVQVLK